MKKLVVAALVLGLAGVAAAGWHVQRSIANGVCPLTGRPIHCRTFQADRQAGGVESLNQSGDVAAQAAPADATECPRTHSRCSCTERRECQEKQVEEAKPAAAPVEPEQKP